MPQEPTNFWELVYAIGFYMGAGFLGGGLATGILCLLAIGCMMTWELITDTIYELKRKRERKKRSLYKEQGGPW